MERTLVGKIDFDGVSYSRALQRFVEKRVFAWIRGAGLAQSETGTEFHVVFTRQGPGHIIYCQIQLRCGEQGWTGARYGQGPHEALAGCLEHLTALREGGPRLYQMKFSGGKRRYVRIPLPHSV